MPPPVTISLSVDIGSSYSFIAFETLLRYRSVWNIDLDVQPILLGGVFKLAGNVSPVLGSPLKAAHSAKDMNRVAQEYGIPFKPGPEFPGNTMPVMKLLRQLKDVLPSEKFIQAFRHYWKENFQVNTPLSSPEFLTSLPADILSPSELADAIEKSKEKRISQLMREESTKLVETYGAFGFPWMVVTRHDGQTECYFGSDRFANMAWWLGPEYRWMGPFPTAKSSL